MRVAVYWNLHKGCWSLMAREGANYGRIIAHADYVELAGVTFTVREAGRLKVLAEKRKNVHAFVVGTLAGYISTEGEAVSVPGGWELFKGFKGDDGEAQQVRYNPYRFSTFVAHGDKPARAADWVQMTETRACMAWGIR